jgi:hypothetical protein
VLRVIEVSSTLNGRSLSFGFSVICLTERIPLAPTPLRYGSRIIGLETGTQHAQRSFTVL